MNWKLLQDGDQGSDATGDKKTESMSKLIEELNSMSNMIDYDKNPQWKYIMQGQNKEPAGTHVLHPSSTYRKTEVIFLVKE